MRGLHASCVKITHSRIGGVTTTPNDLGTTPGGIVCLPGVSSRIVPSAVAAEVTRRQWFSRQNPPSTPRIRSEERSALTLALLRICLAWSGRRIALDREPSRFAAPCLARTHRPFPERLGLPTRCGRGPSAVRCGSVEMRPPGTASNRRPAAGCHAQTASSRRTRCLAATYLSRGERSWTRRFVKPVLSTADRA